MDSLSPRRLDLQSPQMSKANPVESHELLPTLNPQVARTEATLRCSWSIEFSMEREPDRLCVHLLSSLHDEITKFLD